MSDDSTSPDPVSPEEQEQRKPLEENVKSRATWLRLFFMLVLAALYGVSRVVVGATVVLQFFWVLFTGESNKRLAQLGESLAIYSYQVIRYLTFNTEQRPFPFDADWPTSLS